jgi:hypothetical protein
MTKVKYIIVKIAMYEYEEGSFENISEFDDINKAIEEHKRLESDNQDYEWYEITVDYGQD